MPFNIGPGELIIVLIIALIVVGPGRLPDVGASLGKSIREFRKAASDVKESTSLDAAPAQTAAPAPVAPPVPAPVAPPVPALPVAPAPADVATEATTEPAPAPAPQPEAAAEPAGDWPAEVTPVDEQQPTVSA